MYLIWQFYELVSTIDLLFADGIFFFDRFEHVYFELGRLAILVHILDYFQGDFALFTKIWIDQIILFNKNKIN